MASPPPRHVLRLLGLPPETNDADVAKLLDAAADGETAPQLPPLKVWVARKDDGACAGFAFAEFATEEGARRAAGILERHGVRVD